MEKLKSLGTDLKEIISNQENFDFPRFLTHLRSSLCLSRKIVTHDLKIPYLKLFYLEIGAFSYLPDKKIINKLAQYYGVSKILMQKKAENYVGKGKRR